MIPTHSRIVTGLCPLVLALVAGCNTAEPQPPVTPVAHAGSGVQVAAGCRVIGTIRDAEGGGMNSFDQNRATVETRLRYEAGRIGGNDISVIREVRGDNDQGILSFPSGVPGATVPNAGCTNCVALTAQVLQCDGRSAPPVMAAVSASPPPPMVVRVAPDILEACGIDASGKSPFFAFDSSALSARDQRLLDEVATCFETGPLAGRSLTLTGRADPRGTEEYNLSLGDRRATGVQRYLEHHGMAAANLSESSRGALDATGIDEDGWTQDRRVDVDLVKVPVPVASIP
jgi:outer membrane protein OmpA-like peptidoglycan-associated protein